MENSDSTGSLAALKVNQTPVIENTDAALWDIGEGVACFEVRTKMNALSASVLDLLEETLSLPESTFTALVIGNDNPQSFSAGADLAFVHGALTEGEWAKLSRFFARGQSLYQFMFAAPRPVIAAAHGFALGGGCEMIMHCDRVVADKSFRAGLPEFKVGMLPAWGGCTRLYQNNLSVVADPAQAADRTLDYLMDARIFKSPREAVEAGLVRPDCTIVEDSRELLPKAKALARSLCEGYRPTMAETLTSPPPDWAPGALDRLDAARREGKLNNGQAMLASELVGIIGGPSNGQTYPLTSSLEREMAAVLRMAQTEFSRAAINQFVNAKS